jgi:hypothetical protein
MLGHADVREPVLALHFQFKLTELIQYMRHWNTNLLIRLGVPKSALGQKAPFWTSVDDFRSSSISRPFQGPSACLRSACHEETWAISSSHHLIRSSAQLGPKQVR